MNTNFNNLKFFLSKTEARFDMLGHYQALEHLKPQMYDFQKQSLLRLCAVRTTAPSVDYSIFRSAWTIKVRQPTKTNLYGLFAHHTEDNRKRLVKKRTVCELSGCMQ